MGGGGGREGENTLLVNCEVASFGVNRDASSAT